MDEAVHLVTLCGAALLALRIDDQGGWDSQPPHAVGKLAAVLNE
jgi:hypothetical protein